MANYKVDITGINTGDIVVLKNKEMLELFRRYKDGDEFVRDTLINGNLKLVLSILKKFNKVNVNKDDLFQVGVVGLIKAIENFDLSYNLQFSTYAVYLIMGEVKRYLRDNTAYRVSRSTKDIAYKIIKYKEEYLVNNGVYPTSDLIASYLDIDEFMVGYALDSLKEPSSLFEPIHNDGGDTIYLEDKIASRENIDKDTLISLYSALDNLKEREKEVLTKRYIIGKTQSELALEYNISQAQVSRIEKSAISNVRKYMN